jgi:dynein heavy chain 2
MKTLVEEKMRSIVPCIFIVSIGFDPSKEIQEYATKTVGKERFEELSMGGDQNDHALQLLREAAKDGKWLCLKNLHLVIGFVSVLEKEVLSM